MINIDRVYIICSEKYEADKYEKWQQWLDSNNINGEISFYKWGTELTQEEVDSYVLRDGTLEKYYPWRTGYPIRNSEASIAINFIKIFEDAYKKGYNRILTLESDVLLHPDFISKVNEILKMTEQVDLNVISIGCGMGYRIKSESGENIIAGVNQFRCADSLIFTNTAIDYFYNNLKQIRVPVDEEFTRAVQENHISVYWLEPPIAIQQSQMAGNSSQTQNGNYNLRIPWEI
jgi:hypothetical protein